MSVTFYGLIISILSHEIKSSALKIPIIGSLLLLMQVVGFSRIYLRVHYASDVVSGHLIGLGWLLTSLKVLNGLEEFNKNKSSQLYAQFENNMGKNLLSAPVSI
jgi:undecaprenyl-diphosphatase